MRTVTTIGLLTALFMQHALAAGTCVLSGEGMEFTVDGGITLRPPYKAENCGKVTITKGKGTAHFFKPSGERSHVSVKVGDDIDKLVNASSGKTAALTRVVALLAGSSPVQSAFGGGRLKPDSRTLGFPAGVIVASQGGYPINFDPSARLAVAEFLLFDKSAKQPLFRAVNFDDVATIPANVLVPGRRYAWRLRTASGTQAGADFTLAEAEDVRRMEAMMADVAADATLSKADRLVAEAVALDSLGFVYDRDRVVQEYRKTTGEAK